MGLLLLAQDVPILRRTLDHLLCWIERSPLQWLQKAALQGSQRQPLDQP